jgi:predicted nucleic acid-binding Zn ribbon protein
MAFSVPRPVSELVTSAVPGLAERVTELRLSAAWTALAGIDVARRARPGALNAGVLTITVDNSPWLHELTLRSDELYRRVHERFPEVRALRFTLGTLEAERTVRSARQPGPRRLSEEERMTIETAARQIPDTDIAAAARRAMTTAGRYPRGGTR